MRTILCLLFMNCCIFLRAQVVTSFPSLLIHASSRGMGMGDVGIASGLGTQQLLYNASKSTFIQNFHEASVGYMPWLAGISPDTRMLNASYIGNMGNGAWGVALNYLNLGTMDLRDDNGATLASYTSREFNLGGSFAIRLNDNHSLSTTLRFLAQNAYAPNPVNVYSACGDVGYYGFTELGDASRKLEWGAMVSNLGMGKLNLPATASIGIAFTQKSDYSSFMIACDASRLLKDSWAGLRYNIGAEYGYDDQFFLRCGASLEKPQYGNRKFFSFGAGFRGLISDQSCSMDLHYLVPFGASGGVSPFQNCWGLTLGITIGNFQ